MSEERNSLSRAKLFVLVVAAITIGLAVQFSPAGRIAAGQDKWNVPAKAKGVKNPVAANDQSVKKGQELFKANCTMCHGEKGQGDGPLAASLTPKPASINKQTIGGQTDGELFWKISEGKPPMPAFKTSIPEKDRWAIVNFIRTL